MKKEYTNAEKVSDRFLSSKYGELKSRYETFVCKKFFQKLNIIFESEQDNYEKLRQMIHLDAEFEEYLKTKSLFFDIVNEEFSSKKATPYGCAYEEFDIKILSEFCFFCRRDVISFEDCETQIMELISDLTERYLNGKDTNILESILKKLNQEDWEKVTEIITNHFRELFTRILMWDVKKLKEEYGSDLKKDIGYNFEDSEFIYKINLQVFLENFNYPESDPFAKTFKKIIQEILENDALIEKYVFRADFWDMIVFFEEFYKNKIKGDEKIEDEDVSPKHYFCDLDVVKVGKNYEEVIKNRVIANMDFRGLDMSSVELKDTTIVNCNFEGTHATIFLNSINLDRSLYLIQGRLFNRNDLIHSCFKGCVIKSANYEALNRFSFSSDTFDKEILKECGFACDGIDEEVKEKYYRKKRLTAQEIINLSLQNVNVKSRYPLSKNPFVMLWLYNLKTLFPKQWEEICKEEYDEA